MSGWTTLVSAADLRDALGSDGLVVVDARASLADPAQAEAAWRDGHVPGARFADLDRDLSDHGKAHAGRHPWPDDAAFAAALGRLGVRRGDQVVVYDAGDGALAAARLWFMLRAFGHRDAAVLDGGWAHWTSLGFPVERGPVEVPASDYGDGRFDRARLLDADQVQAHLERGGMLVDARAAERFRGDVEPIDRVGGHVPGAVNRPYALNMHDGRFKPASALADEFQRFIGGRPAGDVVVMCGSGVTACHHLLAMEHAGLAGACLFTGSWSGWIDDPSRPVAKG